MLADNSSSNAICCELPRGAGAGPLQMAVVVPWCGTQTHWQRGTNKLTGVAHVKARHLADTMFHHPPAPLHRTRQPSLPGGLAGNKVEQWFRTPFDIAAFGPRAALGALLSMPEQLEKL